METCTQFGLDPLRTILISEVSPVDAIAEIKRAVGTFDATPVIGRGPMQASTPAVSLPPDMQHLLLERVLRSTSDVKFKLKCFSGTSPRPSGEVDYFTWRAQAKEMMEDSEIADKVKRRKIIESLLPPALKVVLGAGSKASAGECFDNLEKGYGNVINASELKAQFSETYQHTRELPSVYLTRLQALAQEVLEAGGVKDAELDSYIQDQFFRGCWHESLLNTLLIRGINCSDRKRSVSYATLLFEVRSIEREHSDKQKRKLRQELEEKGRPLSRSSVQLIKTSENISSAPEKATTIDWKEKYLQVEQQLAGLQMTQPSSERSISDTQFISQRPKEFNSQTNTRFNRRNPLCFNCGQIGHFQNDCKNSPNPNLEEIAHRPTLLVNGLKRQTLPK
uniref:CCHC-type domain-containing protein n=1 Tax=Pelusios castaneus TaxID=367368 RepID=A0A8C8RVT7_9SAUR